MIFFVLILVSLIARLQADDGWITVLTAKDMETKVLQSKEVWLVGSSMTDDQVAVEEYMMLLGNAYSKIRQYNIRVGYIDCNAKSNKKVCTSINVALTSTKFSLSLFSDVPQANPYTNKYFRIPQIYPEKVKDVRQVERFIIQHFSPPNFRIVEKSSIDNIDEEVSSFTKPTLVVVASSEKSGSFKNIVYKVVAQNFSSSIDLVVYKSKKPIQSAKLAIKPEATTIHLMQQSSEIVSYSGDVNSFVDISSWLRTIIGDANDSSSTINSDDEIIDEQVKSYSILYSSSNLTESSIPFDEEWIIAVLKSQNDKSLIGWKKVEYSTGGVVKAVKLDCGTATIAQTLGDRLCSENESSDYIVIVPHGLSARKKFLTATFSKWTTFPASNATLAVKIVGSTLPESSVETVSEQLFDEVMKRSLGQYKLPIFYFPEKGSDSIPPAYLHVALSMSKYTEMVSVSNPSKSFLARFGVTTPSIVCMLPNPVKEDERDGEWGFQPVIFDPKTFGGITYPKLSLFIRRNYLSSGYGKSEAADDLFKEELSQQTAKSAAVTEATNNSSWATGCPSTYRGVCAIHITNKQSDYSENILKAIANEKSREGSLGNSVKLVHVDGECKQSFAEQFSVSLSSMPTLVLYAPFKQRYAVFKGGLSEATAVEFTLSVLGGKTATQPISNRPEMDDKCAVDEPILEDSLEDASDFLAEILAEEKAKSEAAKKAAAEELQRLEEKKKKGSGKSSKKSKKKSKAKKDSEEL